MTGYVPALDNFTDDEPTEPLSKGTNPGILMRIFGIDHRWSISGMDLTEYPEPEDFRDSAVRGKLEIHVEMRRKGPHMCPVCRNPAKVHEYETRRHTGTKCCGLVTAIVSRVPKLRCTHCGSCAQVHVPWAKPKVHYTKALERDAFRLLRKMPLCDVAEELGIGAWTIADMVKDRVTAALDKMDLSDVRMCYIDETSSKKGHNYVTVVCDQNKRIIFMCEGKSHTAVLDFRDWLVEHGGDPGRIRNFSCDLGNAYPKGIREAFPEAKIVYDRFHLAKLATEAVVGITKRLNIQDKAYKTCRFFLAKHEDDMSEAQRASFRSLSGLYKDVGNAYMLKEVLMGIYNYVSAVSAGETLDRWLKTTREYNIPEMNRLARTVESRKEGILAWFDGNLNNGFAECMNSLIQTTKRVARGYRNIRNFINMCYLRNGNLEIALD